MATGASTADLAVVLVDARKGLLTQTRRHSYIVSLLGIRHVVLAVNKMDLVDYDRQVFDDIRAGYVGLAVQLGIPDVTSLPVSALQGDNMLRASESPPWYDGDPKSLVQGKRASGRVNLGGRRIIKKTRNRTQQHKKPRQ